MRKKAFLTIAVLLTVIATSSPLLAQSVTAPRDPQSGVMSPRDPASGMPPGVKAPTDSNSGLATG